MLPKRFKVRCQLRSIQQAEVMNFHRNKKYMTQPYEGFGVWSYIGIGTDNEEGLNIFHNSDDFEIKDFPEYSFEEWKELSSFPKKWYVCPETEENLSLIKKYLNKFKNHTITFKDNAYDCEGNYYSHETHVSSNYTKITMEQFKKHIMKQTQVIVGYKCPIDLFDGEIKVGEVYKACFNKNYYEPSSVSEIDGLELPKEIVETWEPVYEKEAVKMTIGSNEVEITITDVFTFRNKETATIEQVKSTFNAFSKGENIGKYGVGIVDEEQKVIRIGCKDEDNRVSLEELRVLINKYQEINGN